jgi:hypothetical protein
MTDGGVLAPGPFLKKVDAAGLTIDGKAVADQIRKEISATVTLMQAKHGKVRPGSPGPWSRPSAPSHPAPFGARPLHMNP